MAQITKDNAYDAVAPDDFPAMLQVERYGKRSTAFDKTASPRPTTISGIRSTRSTSTSRRLTTR